MKIKCPHCQQEIELTMSAEMARMIVEAMKKNSKIMEELGEEAARAYIKKGIL
jgi:phage FluMu protein Com